MTDYIPCDCEEQTEKHISHNGGCCAQACIAVIQRTSIKEVFERWNDLGLEWKGYTSNKQLRRYLETQGYSVKMITTRNKTDWKAPFYIFRVQWLGNGKNKEKPFYGYKHWLVATGNTHFIVREGSRMFCNSNGWFDVDAIDNYLSDTEPKGIITCLFEIS